MQPEVAQEPRVLAERRPRPSPTDLAECAAKLRAGSKSFSLAARLLPARVRTPATVLYAFCRVADDAIDADPSASRETVEALRRRLDAIYEGRPAPDPVDRALAALVVTERIPRAPLDALLEGLAWDAEGRRYETLDDLYAYAARVAGTVGVLMTVVMGARAPEVLARACDLGVAMQLTNIARDVGEDALRGRVYLPATWLRDAGVDPRVWEASPSPTAAVRAVVKRLLDVADELYARADAGIGALPPDCRMSIRAARLVYAEIGREVARRGYDSVTRRAVVPLWRKLTLLLRALFTRPRALAPLTAPPLGATRFLVSACGDAA